MSGDWFNTFLHNQAGGPGSPGEVALVAAWAFLTGHFIGWIYRWTHKGLSYSQTFVASLVVVPVIVAMMMMLMKGSIVVAFGLLAVFAVVRFRNVLKDTRDTTFILWAITAGLGVGTDMIPTSVFGALAIGAVFIYLRVTSFGSRHRFDAVLSLQMVGELSSLRLELKQLLRMHCSRTLLASQQQAAEDTANLSYRILLRDPDRSNELQAALESTEGIGNVSIFMREDESEV